MSDDLLIAFFSFLPTAKPSNCSFAHERAGLSRHRILHNQLWISLFFALNERVNDSPRIL